MATSYDGIYCNQSRVPGEVRMSGDGLGWRATPSVSATSAARVSKPFLLPAGELLSAQWSRGAHNWLVRIQTRNSGPVQLDGFKEDDFHGLKSALSNNLDLSLEPREHSMRGWNWGDAELDRNELVFNVASRPSFEIPYKQVANTNFVGKAEVAVELNLQPAAEKTTAGDELVELRLYVPPTEEDENAASNFHEQLQDRAEIGSVVGAELASFDSVLFSTPRGRYDLSLFTDAFRLHGKTYDYKVSYTNIQRIFVLPRLDEIHNTLMLQLDPPLRQGQTRYPFLVMQIPRDEELEITLNGSDDPDFESKFEGRLQPRYEELAYQVISQLFKGLANRKITFAGSYVSARSQPAVSCLLKANEGSLYPLEKAFVFVSKSPLYIPYAEVSHVEFSRVASTGRTFDLTIKLRGSNEYQFSSVSRDEQPALESFLASKSLDIKDEAAETRKMIESELAVSGSEGEEEPFDSEEEDSDFEGADDDEDDEDASSGSEDDDIDTGDSKRPASRAPKKPKV